MPLQRTSVSIANHLLTIQGSHLDTVTQISIEGVSHTFQISSQSENEIQAYVSSALKLVAQKSYNLILSSSSAQTIAPITLTLDPLGASEGQVLKFNSTSQAWEPGDLNGLHFIGSWDPTTNDNPSIVSGGYGTGGAPQEGDYYIVSASTTTTAIDSQTEWAIGDWLIYGSDGKWHKLTGENGVKSFKGRTGLVTPQTGSSSSPVEQMRLTTIGLGIGIMTPSEALDVVPGFDLSYSMIMFSYRIGTNSNQCLDGSDQTIVCHCPAGAINSSITSGTHTACFGLNDGIQHNHVKRATYWIKAQNISGAP